MQRYIMRRLIATVPVLAVVAVLTFTLLRLAPGDPAVVIAGPEATPEHIAAIRVKLGLDAPLPVQFWLWLTLVLQGDLGRSILSGHSVSATIAQRLEPTVALGLFAELIAISLAVPLGVIAAWKANTWVDRLIMMLSVLGFAVPSFWLGFNLMWLFALNWRLLPPVGYQPLSEGIGPFLQHLLLPAVTVGITAAALITRMTRATVLEVLREDYIRTARAKGLREWVVLAGHALKNAANPILTIIGISFAGVLTGVVVTENVFGIPGIGRLFADALARRDYAIVQGTILLTAAIYVFINLAVDLMYVYFDPRIRY